MDIRSVRLAVVLAVAWTAGCSINHPIAKDYPAYLAGQQGQASLPRVGADAQYRIDEATRAHKYEFRAASVGYAHVWVVEFGKLLEQTLGTADVRGAFESLTPAGAAAQGLVLDFRLVSYTFENFAARIELEVAASRDGQSLLKKTYQATGANKAGQMMTAGVFGMKNAVNNSTKTALDDILGRFLGELTAALAPASG